MQLDTQVVGNFVIFSSLAIAIVALAPHYLQVIADKKVPNRLLSLLNYAFFMCYFNVATIAIYITYQQDRVYMPLIILPIISIGFVFAIIYLYQRFQVFAN